MNHRVTEGRRTHRDVFVVLALFAGLGGVMAAAWGQQVIARNLDKALDEEISVEWKGVPLEKVVGDLREQTRTNIVVNWAALAKVSIGRDTPVMLRLKNVPYEAVARSILLVLAPRERGLNYVVGDNALEITTNDDLAKSAGARVIDVSAVLAKGGTPEALKGILQTALASAGERVDGSEHALIIQDGILVGTLSKRGEGIVRKVLGMCQSPVKVIPRGGTVPGTAESVRAKKAAAAIRGIGLEKIASGAIDVNMLLLPGAAQSTSPASLDYLIDDAGIVEIGSPAEIAARTLLGVYDMSDLLKRRMARSKATAAVEMDGIVAEVKRELPATSSLSIFGQSVVIFATAPLHRQIATKLLEMYK